MLTNGVRDLGMVRNTSASLPNGPTEGDNKSSIALLIDTVGGYGPNNKVNLHPFHELACGRICIGIRWLSSQRTTHYLTNMGDLSLGG